MMRIKETCVEEIISIVNVTPFFRTSRGNRLVLVTPIWTISLSPWRIQCLPISATSALVILSNELLAFPFAASKQDERIPLWTHGE
jgi:hypothetical protein